MRVPVNREERARRVGNVPYYGANGRTGWIDTHIFDEPLVLVVEDETFTGRVLPFSYTISGKSWVNNHAHVLRPRAGVDMRFLNYALSFYPFTALTTGSTGRRKLTKAALMAAPIAIPPWEEQTRIATDLDGRLSVAEQIAKSFEEVETRATSLRESVLRAAFSGALMASASEVFA
jgi:type I restriction enzyme, S subunit